MKTIKKVPIEPIFIDGQLPDWKDLKEGKLYINREAGCKHLCFCGCGQPIYIYFNHKNGWTLTEKDGKVTISPSLLHMNGCKSHYIITKNVANFV